MGCSDSAVKEGNENNKNKINNNNNSTPEDIKTKTSLQKPENASQLKLTKKPVTNKGKNNMDNKNDKEIDINNDTNTNTKPKDPVSPEAPPIKDVYTEKIIEGFYSKYDINNDYYLCCPDCKQNIPYIENINYREDDNDFEVKYRCNCNCNNKEDYSLLHFMISPESPSNLCENHDKEQLIAFCKMCGKSFCKLCSKAHINHDKDHFISKENGELVIKIVNEKKNKVKGIEILIKIIEKLLKNDEIFEIQDIEGGFSDDNISFDEQNNINDYYCSSTIKGHKDKVVSLIILQSGYVATGSYDSTIRIWIIEEGVCVKVIQEVGSVICLLEFETNIILSGTSQCNIGLWAINNDDEETAIYNYLGHELWVNCLAKCDDKHFASGSNDNTIIIWDYNERKEIKKFKAHDDCVLCLILLKNGNLCSGGADSYIKFWDWNNGLCINSIKAHSNWVKCLCQFDDDILLSGSDDRTIKVWKNYECISTLDGHINSIRALCKINENFFASGSFDNNINIWDYQKQKIVQVLKGHTSNITCLAQLSKNIIISCSTDYTIKLWEKK